MKIPFFSSSPKTLFLSGSSIFLGAFFFMLLANLLQSVEEDIEKNAAKSLGGDIVIRSNEEFLENEKQQIQDIAEKNMAKLSFLNSFNAMVISSDKEILTTVFHVDNVYPLYGEIEMLSGKFSLPKENEIYLDSSFKFDHGLQKGDAINVGEGTFTVQGFFQTLPNVSSFSFFGAKGLLGPSGMEQTQLLFAENRSNHSALLQGTETEKISNEIKQIFTEKQIRISLAANGENTTGRIFEEIKKFSLSLIAAMALLFSTSFFMGVYFYMQSQIRNIAIFQAIGMKRQEIIKKFIFSAGIFWGIVGFLGLITATACVYVFSPKIEEIIGFSVNFSEKIFSTTLAFIVLLPLVALFLLLRKFFTLSPALLLKKNDSSEEKISWKSKKFFAETALFLLLFIPFFIILAVLSGNILFSFAFFLGLLVVFFFLGFILRFLFWLLKKMKRIFTSPFIRTLISLITEKGQKKFFILSGFFALFFLISTVSIIQKSFIENIQVLSGKDAPSAFFIDITKEQKNSVEKILEQEGRFEIYPTMRIKIENLAGKKIDSNAPREISRAFNSLFSDQLGISEKVIAGEIWQAGSTQNEVSVESEFATRNKISLGDAIVFNVLGRNVEFTVTSIRQLKQRDFNPWFIFMFPENVLPSAPKTFLGFWWPADKNQISEKKSEIVRAFPNISVIQTSEIQKSLGEIASLIESGILGISSLLLFSSLLTLLSFIWEVSLQRNQVRNVLRKIGAFNHFINTLLFSEILLVLFFPFLFSLFLGSIVAFTLNYFFFNFSELSFSPTPFVLFSCLLVCSMVLWNFSRRN